MNLLHRSRGFVKRNASTILTVAGGVGVVVTTGMGIQATPKALALLDRAEEEKGEALTTLEKVNVALPVYIPTIVVGVSTIACIFGANVLNIKQQASLTSAYALLDSSYKEYKEKVNELYGENADMRVREELAKDKFDEAELIKATGDELLYYDEFSGRYFNATPARVQYAQYNLNRDIQLQGYASLNDYYEYLGIDPIDSGDAFGWTESRNREEYWQAWVDFNHHKVVMDDGLECYILSFWEEPMPDYQMFC